MNKHINAQIKFLSLLLASILLGSLSIASENNCSGPIHNLTESTIAAQLGWVASDNNRCGGYYIEAPFIYKNSPTKKDLIEINSNEGITFSQHGTSFSQGKITIFQNEQQIIANQAYLYRDPNTHKLNSIDLIGHVVLRSPNELVIAQRGNYNIQTHAKTLADILYRTTIYSNISALPAPPNPNELKRTRTITQLSAYGKAESFTQNEPKIYQFTGATFSTCPPTANIWLVKAKKIILNKITGRGTATNARILLKGVPVFYSPYLNFSIDNRRKTGFLWPTIGTSSKSGFTVTTPFYWNIAPNYDSTITPSYMSKRGVLFTDLFRYLTPFSEGKTKIEILPNDHKFADFQTTQNNQLKNSTDTYVQANLRLLNNASTTRKAFSWQDSTRFNKHWSGKIDYNYVSDDYYLKDLSSSINVITENQLLQQAELNYKDQYWNVLGRLQRYQTLHMLGAPLPVQSQYSRLPEMIINGNYPSEKTGLSFFIANDLTRFDIRDTPGSPNKFPIGDRLHTQPGISWSFYRPYFYFDPRIQIALTKYNLGHINNQDSSNLGRALPIFDMASGLYFDRDLTLFKLPYRQTLEPQIYYVSIPYKDQNNFPLFDTTVNTLNYDQLFQYNRFSGLDRINDANQISAGITTRLIDQQSGAEKIRVGLGQIFYFKNRRVALCNDQNPAICTDTPSSSYNRYNRSPIAGILSYTLTNHWNVTANTLWNAETSSFDNQSLTVQYLLDLKHIINLNYTYIRNGDTFPGDPPGGFLHPISQTNLSLAWGLFRDWEGYLTWTQNWNHNHFQNLLYGLQYDSCCWALRFVTGRMFVGLNPDNSPQYNNQFFVQFALKGLGNIGNNDPTSLLNSSISGYQSNFGQDF
jgi:LPS-assembly protein